MKTYPIEIVSDAKGNVLRVRLNNGEKWLVIGKCDRCGKCCERGTCGAFGYEILNGIKTARCDAQVHGRKPWQCKIFPTNPYDEKERPEGCNYTWEKI